MPNRIERLVLWLVPALALQFVAYIFVDGYTPDMSPGAEDESIGALIFRGTVAPLLIYVPNVVTAIWMWQSESASNGRRVRWTLAAFLLSYFVLIPYIGMYILWRLERRDPEPIA